MADAGVVAALERIEARQVVYEQVMHRVIGMMAVHNEKLDAILNAASREPGPSSVAEVLGKILGSLQDQEQLLRELPEVLAAAIRGEFDQVIEAAGVEMESVEL